MEHARNGHDRAGRILGPLEHDRAAGADGGGDLADGLVVREVPGREGGADADGLAHHDLADVGIARLDNAAVDAPAFLGVPIGVFGAGGDFAHGFGQRLALIQRHVAADLLGALSRQRGDLAQDRRAVHGRGFLPRFESALGGGKGAIQIRLRGVGQLTEHLERGRVDDVLGAPALAGDEFAVDIQRQLFIHACRSLRNRNG